MVDSDPLDREIDALLDVEPSSDFVARVRATVDAHPPPAGGWIGRRWMVVAASVVMLVVMCVFWRAQIAPSGQARPIVPAAATLESPAPIVIEPIRIAPLLTADLELGEQQ